MITVLPLALFHHPRATFLLWPLLNCIPISDTSTPTSAVYPVLLSPALRPSPLLTHLRIIPSHIRLSPVYLDARTTRISMWILVEVYV